MEKLILDPRLQTVADFVREGSVVADIGTDHGHLVCKLVSERKCPRAYACDINDGPLARARRNIIYHGLDARILTLRTDGLYGIAEDAVDDVVIAGMGGDLIARILLDWQGCRAAGKRFILQPMTKAEHLRAALYREGFMLVDEVAVISGNFVYTVMVAEYSGVTVEVSKFFAWTGKLWEKPMDLALQSYLIGVHETFCKKAEGYAVSGKHPAKAMEYAVLAERICERLERTPPPPLAAEVKDEIKEIEEGKG